MKKTIEPKPFCRSITAEELANLSNDWENPTVDTAKYYQNVVYAYEVDRVSYEGCKKEGCLCQVCNGKYYIA